jgi:hypothetical protein
VADRRNDRRFLRKEILRKIPAKRKRKIPVNFFATLGVRPNATLEVRPIKSNFAFGPSASRTYPQPWGLAAMSKKILRDDHDAEFIRGVYRLIQLCPRAVAEIFIELGAEFLLRTTLEQKFAYYLSALGALGPEVLDAVGANQLPSPRGRRRRPRRYRISTTARKKPPPATPWDPVPFEWSERRPGR